MLQPSLFLSLALGQCFRSVLLRCVPQRGAARTLLPHFFRLLFSRAPVAKGQPATDLTSLSTKRLVAVGFPALDGDGDGNKYLVAGGWDLTAAKKINSSSSAQGRAPVGPAVFGSPSKPLPGQARTVVTAPGMGPSEKAARHGRSTTAYCMAWMASGPSDDTQNYSMFYFRKHSQ